MIVAVKSPFIAWKPSLCTAPSYFLKLLFVVLSCLCTLRAEVSVETVADAVAHEGIFHIWNRSRFVENGVRKPVMTKALLQHKNCLNQSFYFPVHRLWDRQHHFFLELWDTLPFQISRNYVVFCDVAVFVRVFQPWNCILHFLRLSRAMIVVF